MKLQNKISLIVPNDKNVEKHFTLSLKQNISNERSEYDNPGKIAVVSDIEGNFRAFVNSLLLNKVIDNRLRWVFENGHLVILGDCFDRGEQVSECLWLVYYLEELAAKQGGHVHYILGNHEIMNLNGDWRYVHPKYATSSKSGRQLAAIYGGNIELWRWLCTKNIVERIGDILFVHAGISPELIKLDISISEMNNLVRPFYSRANEQFSDPDLNIFFNSEKSPFWYRGYYQDAVTEEQINAILQHFDVKTIITGHTVVDRVTSFFNGKVINVDTDHASGNSESLLVKNDMFYRVDKEGKQERIK